MQVDPKFILHKGANVKCFHGGIATPKVTYPKVKIMDLEIVLQPSTYTIVSCPFAPVAPSPCVTAQWLTASTKVFCDNMPIVLTDSSATCAPNGTPLSINDYQKRVQAV